MVLARVFEGVRVGVERLAALDGVVRASAQCKARAIKIEAGGRVARA